MLSQNRQEQVDVILNQIRSLPFVDEAWSDDFTSDRIDIFCTAKVEERAITSAGGPCAEHVQKFEYSMRTMKSQLEKIPTAAILDYPAVKYEYDPNYKKNVRLGYDQDYFKIDVVVLDQSTPIMVV